jgi:hypothetical protein
MHRTLLLSVLLAVPTALPAQETGAQYDPDRQFPVEQLRDDFALLRSALEDGHAGLYRYSDRAAIDLLFDEAAARIRVPMTELEFMRLVAPVIAGVNDGHTGLNPSRRLAPYLTRVPHLLPFNLRFSHGRAYVLRNYSDDPDFVLGAEITHINGVTVAEVLAQLLPVMPSDGRIETSKYRRGLESTTTFGRMHSIALGLTTRFELTYVPPAGDSPRTIVVHGIAESEVNRRFQERYPEAAGQNAPPIEVTYRNGVPILTVRTFGSGSYRAAEIDYPTFLREAFEEFDRRGVEHLIIDVRGNGGGTDEYGKLLAAYLMDGEFSYYAALEINAPTFAFLEHTQRPDWQMPPDRVRKNDRGVYDVLGHPNLGPQQPLAPGFRGEAIILIDGGSFSATGEFTSVVHHHGKATFVGEESAAGYYGNTSGGGATLTLPHTGLRIRIPFIRYTCAVSGYEPRDRGLIPDHPVAPTIEDVLADRDVVMEYAVELTRQ